ncbi:theronine dehydrogenase-like Zn-dependent dehydrogenase [Lachnospiraceae bacterium JC7]|nr:theronine dehydrogenase-like Zn-dependent dehydrogenase [Lachnospiraceae bacterium JC7]
MEKIKAVRIMEPEDLRIVEEAKPEIDEKNNVLVQVKASGLCGSDAGIYHGTNAAATYPRIIGHEIVGEVVQCGPTAKKVKVGDRVIIDQVTACGHCYACRHGRPNVCQNLQVRGVHIDGGYREFIAVPDEHCYILPDGLRYVDAVLIEPTTIAVQACSRAEIKEDDEVLINGQGALGARMLSIVKLYHPKKIIVSDIFDEKLQEALGNGADVAINPMKENFAERLKEVTSDGYGPTVSIDCACTKDSLGTLIGVTGNAGRVITMGFTTSPTEVTNFGITSKELDIRGSRLQNRKFQEVIDLVKEGKVDLDHKISHVCDFREAQSAFDFNDTHDPSIRKIVFTMDGEPYKVKPDED